MNFYASMKPDCFVKVQAPNLGDDKSIIYHALCGCPEVFGETVNHSNYMELLGV